MARTDHGAGVPTREADVPKSKTPIPGREELRRGGYNPLPAETSETKEQFGPLPTDSPATAKTDDNTRRADGERSSRIPDPLVYGNIEGQNPHTPERVPGHTRYYSERATAGAHWNGSSVLMMAVALAALAALIVMLATPG